MSHAVKHVQPGVGSVPRAVNMQPALRPDARGRAGLVSRESRRGAAGDTPELAEAKDRRTADSVEIRPEPLDFNPLLQTLIDEVRRRGSLVRELNDEVAGPYSRITQPFAFWAAIVVYHLWAALMVYFILFGNF